MVKTGKMKCVSCWKKRTFRETHVFLQPANIKCKAWKCTSCGEAYLEPEATQKALLLNKLERGFKVRIGQLGNSDIFRFPVEVVRLLGLKKGQEVSARVVSNNGKFVFEITPN